MPSPRVLILRAPGTNCDGETAHAFSLVGGQADVLHVNRLLEKPSLYRQYQILCIPGGFSFGDDIASGRIFANLLKHHLAEALEEFKAAGKLILGICNGFQVLIQTKLLLDDHGGQRATLAWNRSGKFEDRWVHLRTEGRGAASLSRPDGSREPSYGDGPKCVFLSGIETMYLPVAHGEGRFAAISDAVLDELEQAGQLVLRYAAAPQPSFTSPKRERGTNEPVTGEQHSPDPGFEPPRPPQPPAPSPQSPATYPDNPNGAERNV
ncbi:MAG TPA: phosphoribosylformylglycinamidine synthase subunit PurQ, partial [Pirellulales bacterium]